MMNDKQKSNENETQNQFGLAELTHKKKQTEWERIMIILIKWNLTYSLNWIHPYFMFVIVASCAHNQQS